MELVEQTTCLEIAGANSSINNPSHETISEVNTAGSSTSNLEVKMDRLMDILERNLTCEEPDEQLSFAGRGKEDEAGGVPIETCALVMMDSVRSPSWL